MHLFKKLANSPPMSLYMLDRYGELALLSPEAPASDILQAAHLEAYGSELSDEDILICCQRLEAHGNKAREEAEKAQAKPKKVQRQGAPKAFVAQHFADYYNHFLQGLDTTQSLLWLADFDDERAWRLYVEADYELVEAMIATKRNLEQERNRLLYEGPLFGFGGKYSTSPGRSNKDEGEVRVHDLTDKTPEQALALITAMQKR